MNKFFSVSLYIIAALIIILGIILAGTIISRQTPDDSLKENQQLNVNYGNAKDYLLNDSEIESAGFEISRQIMRGTLTPGDSKIIDEARFVIPFVDPKIDEGGDDIQQIVRIFSSSKDALEHFETIKTEEEYYNSHSDNGIVKTTVFSNNFGDKSYAFHRVETLDIIHSNVEIIFVKNNIYIQFASHVNNEDYNKKMLQLGTIAENKI